MRNKLTPTFRLDATIIAGGLALAGVLVFLTLANPFGGSASSPAAAGRSHAVMPGHGAVMPTDVRVTARRGQLQVAMGDYWFKPSARRLHAGVYVFTARNYGVTAHDIMIERMPIKFSGPNAPVDEAAPYGLDGMEPGGRRSTRVALSAGRWEIFCSVPGHYASGQHEVITVYGQMPRGMGMPKRGMGDGSGAGMGMS